MAASVASERDWPTFLRFLKAREETLRSEADNPIMNEARREADEGPDDTELMIFAPYHDAQAVRWFLYLLNPWVPVDVSADRPNSVFRARFKTRANAGEMMAYGHGRLALRSEGYPYQIPESEGKPRILMQWATRVGAMNKK